MESDVEYRRGLPFNLSSFMGSGVHDQTETEDSSEQNGNQQKDEKEAAGEEAKPGNPKIEFNVNLIKLLKGLVRHLNPDKAVDDMLRDFFGCRLPPSISYGNFVVALFVLRMVTCAYYVLLMTFRSPAIRQGDEKLVYRLIQVFSSTEIFSKRRKIYAC